MCLRKNAIGYHSDYNYEENMTKEKKIHQRGRSHPVGLQIALCRALHRPRHVQEPMTTSRHKSIDMQAEGDLQPPKPLQQEAHIQTQVGQEGLGPASQQSGIHSADSCGEREQGIAFTFEAGSHMGIEKEGSALEREGNGSGKEGESMGEGGVMGEEGEGDKSEESEQDSKVEEGSHAESRGATMDEGVGVGSQEEAISSREREEEEEEEGLEEGEGGF